MYVQAVIARKELRKSQLEKRRLQRLEKRTGGQRPQEPQPSNQSRVPPFTAILDGRFHGLTICSGRGIHNLQSGIHK